MKIKMSCVISFLLLIFFQQNITAQGGWNRVQVPVPSDRHIWDLHFFSPDSGWFIGQTTRPPWTLPLLAHTVDGTTNWDTIILPPMFAIKLMFWDKSYSLLLCGGPIFRSEDAWQTYKKTYVDTVGFAGAGEFASASTIFIGGNNTLLKSIDSGYTWTYLQMPVSVYGRISDFSIIDSTTVYAISFDFLFKSTDCGESWNIVPFPISGYRWQSVKFVDKNYGWIAGSYRQIYLTRDGGKTWENQSIFGHADYPRSMSVLDSLTAAISTSQGAILWTTDAGENWIEQVPEDRYKMLHKIQILNHKTAYACGNYGTFLKTTTGGVTWVEENNSPFPKEYSLNQNYPNPFNPSTTINYELPQDGVVALKVYDILGKVVQTLVNEYKTKGRYEVNFDASSLSSGMYIYEIKSGDYKASKKMTLLK
ncbi:MAG: T9SS type A sorting domain-containing protein [Ignavibacteriaceae bacterium]|nr:T9SS type A sorting domain-containing protein [Ignavibacteriaceae bacterium]